MDKGHRPEAGLRRCAGLEGLESVLDPFEQDPQTGPTRAGSWVKEIAQALGQRQEPLGAGINRRGEAGERAAHRRSSDPRWPRVMRGRPQGCWRSVGGGSCRRGDVTTLAVGLRVRARARSRVRERARRSRVAPRFPGFGTPGVQLGGGRRPARDRTAFLPLAYGARHTVLYGLARHPGCWQPGGWWSGVWTSSSFSGRTRHGLQPTGLPVSRWTATIRLVRRLTFGLCGAIG